MKSKEWSPNLSIDEFLFIHNILRTTAIIYINEIQYESKPQGIWRNNSII